MRKRLKKQSLITTLSFVTTVIITLGTAARAQPSKVQLQFISFPASPHLTELELFQGKGEETLLVQLPSKDLSVTYEVTAQPSWVLGKTTKDPSEEHSFSIYGQAPSLSEGNQIILVLRKGLDDSDGFEVIPLSGNPSNFGGGTYFLYNASRVDIAGAIGSGKFALKPGTQHLLAPKPTEVKNSRKYAFTEFFYRKNKEIQPFFSSTWRFNDTVRSMVFFYHDPKTKHLRIHTIRDYL